MTCIDSIMTRCSIRWFKQDPLSINDIYKLLEAAIRAPTAQGAEQWFFIVVVSEEKRRIIHKLLRRAHEYYATSTLIKPYNSEAVSKWMKKIDEGMYMAPVYIAAYIDLRNRVNIDEYYEYEETMARQSLSAALENLIITAWSMGIGSVWLGVPLLFKEEFNKVLEPPDGCVLEAIIALGYPSETPRPRRRKPLSEVTKVI